MVVAAADPVSLVTLGAAGCFVAFYKFLAVACQRFVLILGASDGGAQSLGHVSPQLVPVELADLQHSQVTECLGDVSGKLVVEEPQPSQLVQVADFLGDRSR